MSKVKVKRVPVRKNDFDINPANESHRSSSSNGGGNNYARAMQGKTKQLELANDAMRAGDRVTAERHLQHADHFHRIISAHKSIEVRPGRKYNSNEQGPENINVSEAE